MPPDITEIMKKYKCCLFKALLIFNSIKEDNADELCTNKQNAHLERQDENIDKILTMLEVKQ